jgi:hypothetical protein
MSANIQAIAAPILVSQPPMTDLAIHVAIPVNIG